MQLSGPQNNTAVIAAQNSLSIEFTDINKTIATARGTNAIASATTVMEWAFRDAVLIWLITPLLDMSLSDWRADTCSLVQLAIANGRE